MLPDLLFFQREFAAAIDQPAAGAMAVYRNTVLHGAVEALRANFPVIEQLVGSEMFQQVAVDHASECPPRTPVLALYGERFPDWLEEQHWSAVLPYLADVARVERLHVECLMAADAEAVGKVRGEQVPGFFSATLTLHPAARFAWLPTPAMSIWLAHQRAVGAVLSPEWKAQGALFARPSPFVLHAPRIGPAAHRMLFGIRLGESAGIAIQAAANLYPDENAGAVFASLLNLGVFAAPVSERTDP